MSERRKPLHYDSMSDNKQNNEIAEDICIQWYKDVKVLLNYIERVGYENIDWSIIDEYVHGGAKPDSG